MRASWQLRWRQERAPVGGGAAAVSAAAVVLGSTSNPRPGAGYAAISGPLATAAGSVLCHRKNLFTSHNTKLRTMLRMIQVVIGKNTEVFFPR